jgi:hypothetical protein
MFKKIIRFIKYNTIITAMIAIAFIAVASVMAANEDVKKVIGEEIVERSGVDNTVLLAADLENFDLKMEITGALEDEENFYIDYQYNTLAIKDNVWQEVLVEKQLTVSKASLDGRDLGLYLMEELGEIIDYQLAFLKEVQEKEEEKGVTVVLEKTEYTGLIGLVFNTKTKELSGYEPVVKPEVADSSAPQPSGTMEPTGDGETSDDYSGDLENSAYYEFLINNCLSNGGYWYGGTCNAEAEIIVPVCDSENLDLCVTQELCEGADLYWYDSNDEGNEICNFEEPPHPNPLPPGEGDDEDTADPSICDVDNLDLCIDQDLCEGAGLFWYDSNDDGSEICNLEEPPHPNPLPSGEGGDKDPVTEKTDEEICLEDLGLYWYGGECHLEEEEE